MNTKAKKAKEKAWKKKCREYSRFLKDDCDFDWTDVLLLLRYKLQRTRNAVEAGYHNNKKKTAAEIKQVEKLIWRICEFDYQSDVFKQFYKKHGKPRAITVECNPPHKFFKRFKLVFSKNGKCKRETPAMARESKRLYLLADAMKKADLKKALDLINSNLFGWWA